MGKQQLSTVLYRFGYKHLVTVYKICAHLFLPDTCWRNRKKMFVDVQTNPHAYGRGLNFSSSAVLFCIDRPTTMQTSVFLQIKLCCSTIVSGWFTSSVYIVAR